MRARSAKQEKSASGVYKRLSRPTACLICLLMSSEKWGNEAKQAIC